MPVIFKVWTPPTAPPTAEPWGPMPPCRQSDQPCLDDLLASRELNKGQPEYAIRYLREIIAPMIQSSDPYATTTTIHMIADMIEQFELQRKPEFAKVESYLETVRLGWRINEYRKDKAETLDPTNPHATETKNVIVDFNKEYFKDNPLSKTKCYEALQTWKSYKDRQKKAPDNPLIVPEPRRRSGKSKFAPQTPQHSRKARKPG
jgi:hypothetical protein